MLHSSCIIGTDISILRYIIFRRQSQKLPEYNRCYICLNYTRCVHSITAGATFVQRHFGLFLNMNVAWKYWQSRGLFFWACFQNVLALYSLVLVHLLNIQKTKRPLEHKLSITTTRHLALIPAQTVGPV